MEAETTVPLIPEVTVEYMQGCGEYAQMDLQPGTIPMNSGSSGHTLVTVHLSPDSTLEDKNEWSIGVHSTH